MNQVNISKTDLHLTYPVLRTYNYKKNNNIIAKLPPGANQLINSYDFDYQFSNNAHECPFNSIEEIFNIEEIVNSELANNEIRIEAERRLKRKFGE